MANRVGLESRFVSRFARFGDVDNESIQAADEAKNVADKLNTARGIIRTQQENITALFTTATEVIGVIDHHQQSSGLRQVNNLPLPNSEIKESYGKQLGYIQMTMRFLSAGLTHFMYEQNKAKERVHELEKLVKSIAQYDGDLPLVGQIQQLDVDDLEADPPVAETRSEMIPGSETSTDDTHLLDSESVTPSSKASSSRKSSHKTRK